MTARASLPSRARAEAHRARPAHTAHTAHTARPARRARGGGFLRGVLCALLLALGASAQSDEPVILVEVTPEAAQVGLLMDVTVTVSGAVSADCEIVAAPRVDGARLALRSGPNYTSSYRVDAQTQWTRASWTYQFVPERAGEIELPPFTLACRGREWLSPATRVVVSEPTGLLAETTLRLDVIPSADDIWVGQVVSFDVEAAVREDIIEFIPRTDGLSIELPWLEGAPGLHLQPIPAPPCHRANMRANGGRHELPVCVRNEMRGGHRWVVYSTTIPMLATRAGRTGLPESLFSARVVTETALQQNPLSIFGGRRQVATRVVEVMGRAKGPPIVIRDTPEEGRPAHYGNAVGTFTFSGEVEPREVAVGESCRLTLAVSLADPGDPSSGNLAMLEWPAFLSLENDFRIFGKEERDLGHTRVLEFELSPKSIAVQAVPALEFAAFDPTRAAYDVLTVGPFSLDVRPGGQDGLTTALATEEELLNDLETIREDLPAPRDVLPPWTVWAFGGVLLGAAEWQRHRRRVQRENPLAAVRRGARRRLDAELREAAGARDVAASFARYLARRLGGPAAGLTAEEAAARLDDRALAAEVRTVVGRWEAAYLGGAPLEAEAAKSQARDLADRLEKAT